MKLAGSIEQTQHKILLFHKKKKIIEKSRKIKIAERTLTLTTWNQDIFNLNSSLLKLSNNRFLRSYLQLQRTSFPNMCLDLLYLS